MTKGAYGPVPMDHSNWTVKTVHVWHSSQGLSITWPGVEGLIKGLLSLYVILDNQMQGIIYKNKKYKYNFFFISIVECVTKKQTGN